LIATAVFPTPPFVSETATARGSSTVIGRPRWLGWNYLTYSTYPFYLFYSFFPFYSSDYFGQTLSLESLIISETDGLQNHSGGNEIQIYLIYLTYPFYSFYSSFPFYLFYSLVSRMGLGLTTDIVTQHGSS